MMIAPVASSVLGFDMSALIKHWLKEYLVARVFTRHGLNNTPTLSQMIHIEIHLITSVFIYFISSSGFLYSTAPTTAVIADYGILLCCLHDQVTLHLTF